MMLKHFLLSASAVLLGILPLSAQDSNTAAQTIRTGHLRGIKARQGFVVSLRQDATSGATITVDSRLQPYLRAEVRDGILCLGFDQMPRELQRKNLSRRAEVTVSSLDELEAHSGAHITGTGRFTASGECEIDVHSGALVTGIDITAKEIEIDVHSGARAVMTGTTDRLEAETHSGATADLSGLKARDVQADASSGSSIRCWATESISGRASSGASVRYKGGATHVRTGSSSGGSYGPMK